MSICVRVRAFDVKPFKMLICCVSVSHEKQNELNRLCVCGFYFVPVTIYPSCVDMFVFFFIRFFLTILHTFRAEV